MNDQTTMERPLEAASNRSTIQSILLHIQDDATLDSRVETALSLARSTGAHLSCLHVTPIQAYVAFDSFGGVFVMKEVMEKLDEQEASLRARVEKKLGSEDVTWDYEQITGDVIAQKAISWSAGESVLRLTERLYAEGARLLLASLGARATPQSGAGNYDSWPSRAQLAALRAKGVRLFRWSDLLKSF